MPLPQIREGTTLLEFYRQLLTGAPVVNGKTLACLFVPGDGALKGFPHGLGRLPQNALVGLNSASGSCVAQVDSLDTENVYVRLSAPVSSATIKVWVY